MKPVSHFATTHWSLVKAAGLGPSSAREALEKLCLIYWPAVYAYVKRFERNEDTARDLTQDFFARILERNTIALADQSHGRFRTFLLTALKHFLLDEKDKARTQKRGGNRAVLSLDFADADSRLSFEPSHELTPDKIFEREWALRLLDVVLDRLKTEYESAGNLDRFELLKPAIGQGQQLPLAEAALHLGLSETAARVAAHRLRKRYRDLLREEIMHTVDRPEDIDEELNHLFIALSQSS